MGAAKTSVEWHRERCAPMKPEGFHPALPAGAGGQAAVWTGLAARDQV